MTEVITLIKCGVCHFEFKKPQQVQYYNTTDGNPIACYTCPRCKQIQQASPMAPVAPTAPKFDLGAAVANVQLPAINTLTRTINISAAAAQNVVTAPFQTLALPQHPAAHILNTAAAAVSAGDHHTDSVSPRSTLFHHFSSSHWSFAGSRPSDHGPPGHKDGPH